MANGSSVDLAMPVGVPPEGANLADHWNALRARLAAAVDAAKTVQVWVADEDPYSRLACMTRGFLRYLPAGAPGPAGTAVATPWLLLKPWLWDYLALREKAPAGVPLPKIIAYGNVEASDVRQAVRAELSTRDRYATLTAAERTQAENDFIAGSIQLLVTASATIGRAIVDAAPADPARAGRRRLDLRFFDQDGSVLDPQPYFELWALIAGPLVRDHPLAAIFTTDVTPAVAPLEGGTRVRVVAAGSAAGTVVTVGGIDATDAQPSVDGAAVYATLPAGVEGLAEVVVTIPALPAMAYPDAVRYVSDVATTTRAVLASYAVEIEELIQRGQNLAALGTLDDQARTDISFRLQQTQYRIEELVVARSVAGGGNSNTPEISSIWEQEQDRLTTLLTAVDAYTV